MKKFLTLALALVMVFAISSTAFAAGWGDIYVAPTYDEIEMKLEALSLKQNATGIFNMYDAYTVLSVNYPVVEDTDVHAGITIKIPGRDDISPETLAYMRNGQVQLRLDFTNFEETDMGDMLNIDDATGGFEENYTLGYNATDVEYTVSITDGHGNAFTSTVDEDGGYIVIPEQMNNGTDYLYVEIWGKASSDKTDVVIEAQIGVFNEWYDGVSINAALDDIAGGDDADWIATGVPAYQATIATASNVQFFTFYAENTDDYYTVVHNDTANTFDVINADNGSGLYGFRFYYRNDDRGILDVHPGEVLMSYDFLTCDAADPDDVYLVTDAHNATSTYAFFRVSDATHYHSTRNVSDYNDLVDVLEEIHDALGFTYDGTDYMHPDHYDLYFGIHNYYVEEEIWPSGYVAELVVDDPSVNPPQTGDNASIAGFVMIAIALVAAAAVTIKKVRA